MKPRHLLKELEQVAAAVQLSVRTQAFRNSGFTTGGLCKVRGTSVVLLNSRANPDERALVLAEVLSKIDTTRVAMSEDARDFLKAHTRGNDQRPPAGFAGSKSAGPGLARSRPRH